MDAWKSSLLHSKWAYCFQEGRLTKGQCLGRCSVLPGRWPSGCPPARDPFLRHSWMEIEPGKNWLRCCSFSDAAHKSFESSVSFRGDDSPTVLPLYVHGVYLAATTTDWRCPYRVNEWGTPHSSSLSLIYTGTHTSAWNIWRTPVTTPTLWSHTVKPYRGNWPWTLNWLDGVIPRLVYTKESLN